VSHPILKQAVVIGAGMGGLAAAKAVAAHPAVFDVANRAAILVAHGIGAQIYECKVGDTAATNWVFREPVATLILGGGTIGHHYVGPPGN
jgi:pimeloyl-ACP methyl ester carboxylesterase